MRRLLVLLALLGLLVASPTFAPAPVLGVEPMTLIAFGFLVLVASAAGDLAARLGIPSLVAHALVGLLLGPHVVGLATPRVGADLQWMTDLATGLLAMLAGALVDPRALRGVRRSLAAIVGLQVVAAVGVTALAVVLLSQVYSPLLAGLPPGSLILAALLAGVVAIVDGPLLLAAVTEEAGAEGPVTRLALAATVTRTLVALTLLAAVLVLLPSGPRTGPPGGAAALGWLGLSGASGLAIAAAVGITIRASGRELLSILVVALIAAAVTRQMGAEPSVAFLVAGLLVRLSVRDIDPILHLLRRVAWPAALVVFATLGATYDPDRIAPFLAIGAALAAVRSIVLVLATAAASKLTHLDMRTGWALAGTQLGQAPIGLVAALGVAQVGGWAEGLALALAAMVAVDLLLAPPVVRIALARAGETVERRRAVRRARTQAELEEAEPVLHHPRERPAIPEPRGFHPDLERALTELRTRLFTAHERFTKDSLDERLHEAKTWLETLRGLAAAHLMELEAALSDERASAEKKREAIRLAGERITKDWRDATAYQVATLQERGPEARALLSAVKAVEDAVLGSPPVRVPVDFELFTPGPKDGALMRLRMRLAGASTRVSRTLGVRRGLFREVPLGRLGRLYLSGALPEQLAQAVAPLIGHRSTRPWVTVADTHRELVMRLRSIEASDQPGAMLERLRTALDTDLRAAQDELTGYREEIATRVLLALGTGFEAVLEAARVAGTPLLPRRRTDPSRVFERNRRGRATLEEDLGRWWIAARGVAGQLLLQLDAAAVHRPAMARAQEGATGLRSVVQRGLMRLPKRMLAACQSARDELSTALVPDRGRDELLRALEDAQAALVLASDTTDLERMREEGQLSGALGEASRHLRLVCEKLPPTVDVLADASMRLDPGTTPDAELAPFPLREVASTLFGQHAGARLSSVEPAIDRAIEATFMTLVDGANTVRFHLEAALAELAQAPESDVPPDTLRLARDFALGGIGRVIEALQTYTAAVEQETEQHARDIARVLEDAAQRLSDMAERADVQEAAALLGAGEGPEGILAQAPEPEEGRIRQLRRRLFGELSPTATAMARRVGTRMGLLPSSDGRLVDEAEQADFRATQNADVPETYRRLFLPSPLTMDSLFVMRPDEMASLDAAIARWERGEPTAILIAAAAGLGRRSLLERALRTRLSEYPTQRRRIGTRVTSAPDAVRELSRLVGSRRELTEEELRAKLLGATGHTVRVVEDAHRLLLPHPLALGGMQRFLRAITESGPQVLWIVTVEAHALSQLDTLLRFTESFTHVVSVHPFDRAATERLLMARHQVSGVGVTFLAEKAGRRVPTQAALRKELFDRLHESAGGHPALILYYWLRAVRRYDDKMLAVEVRPHEPLRFEFLERLHVERLLDLERLLRYGAMTPQGFARAQRILVHEAEMRLSLLARSHLLRSERVGHELRFSLNPVLVHPLTRLLEERNIL